MKTMKNGGKLTHADDIPGERSCVCLSVSTKKKIGPTSLDDLKKGRAFDGDDNSVNDYSNLIPWVWSLQPHALLSVTVSQYH